VIQKSATTRGNKEYLSDMKRFAQFSRSSIEETPLQLYHSCIAFAPFKSLVRQRFIAEHSSWQLKRPVKDGWSPLIQVLRGHSDYITSMACSPKSGLVASGSMDKTIRVWDPATGANLHRLDYHTGAVTAVAFSPDGNFLVSSSDDYDLKLWDVELREVVFSGIFPFLQNEERGVTSIEISRTGKFLATNSYGVLRVWKLLDRIRPDSPVVLDCPWTTFASAFSPEQDLLAVKTGKEVFLWDAEKQTRVWTHEAENGIHSGGLYDTLCFSMDGKVIAGQSNCTIILWDASSGSEVRRLSGHTELIWSASFSPFDPDLLASCSEDRTIRIWRRSSETPLKTLTGDWVYHHMDFSPDRQRQDFLSVAGFNVNVWDTTVDIKPSAEVFPPAIPFYEANQIEITISPDSSLAASRSDRWIIISDTRDGAIKHKLEMHPTGYLCFSPGGELLMSESGSEIVAWDPSSGDQVLAVEQMEGFYLRYARDVKHRFSPNGKLLVVASDKALDGRVRLWSLEARDYTVDLDAVARPGFQTAFAFSVDSKMLARATDSDISIYDTMSGKLLRMLPNPKKDGR
jgi:WD40 repeat protein